MSQCSNETSCETACETEDCQPCHDSAEECPLQCAADMWRESFCDAMREVQVEILKAKIVKAHGPMLEEAADALLESMMACWQAKIAKVHAAEAAEEFKGKLHELWTREK